MQCNVDNGDNVVRFKYYCVTCLNDKILHVTINKEHLLCDEFL